MRNLNAAIALALAVSATKAEVFTLQATGAAYTSDTPRFRHGRSGVPAARRAAVKRKNQQRQRGR